MEIKRATIGDLKEIQELNLRLFKKEYKEYDKTLDLSWTTGKRGKKYFKESISNSGSCALVAKENGKVVGYLIGAVTEIAHYRTKIKKQIELENMFVLETKRNQKVGTKLVEAFIKWARMKGADNISVTAAAQNKKGIRFYRKLGFRDYNCTLERSL